MIHTMVRISMHGKTNKYCYKYNNINNYKKKRV